MNAVAEALVASIPWRELRAGPGTAAGVPEALTALAAAESGEAARELYWRVDKGVVGQGRLYESAVPVVHVVYALLADPLPAAARHRLVELLVEIAGGETAQAEVEAGADDVAERCRAALREGLWTCYGLLGDPDPRVRDQALTLLGWLEERPELIVPVLDRVAGTDADPGVRAAAAELRAEY